MKKIFILSLFVTLSFSSTLDEFLLSLKSEAVKESPEFKDFDYKRGEKIFFTKNIGKKGELISCASCHGEDLKKEHQNHFTGKSIEALSPKANPQRFTQKSEIEKWLKRNFNDVFVREGTALEKGDVITYIINQ